MSGKRWLVVNLVLWVWITLISMVLLSLEAYHRKPVWMLVIALLLIAVGTFQATTYAAALRMRGRR